MLNDNYQYVQVGSARKRVPCCRYT